MKLLGVGLILLVVGTFSLNLKSNQNIVVDHTSDPTLQGVIRRTPAVTVETRMSPMSPPESASPIMNFGNTSDNNGVGLNYGGYGKNPEIAGPAIYVHSKGKMSVIEEAPAHVGWRSEKKIVTSLNKATSIYII